MTPAAISAHLERFWWRTESVAVFVVVRVAYGITVLGWAVSLIPDFGRIFDDDGLHRNPFFEKWAVINPFRYLQGDLVLAVGLGLLVVAAIAVVGGQWLRITLPLCALLQMSLARYADPWLIGAEDVLRLIGMFLGLFALISPATLSARNGVAQPSPRWPLLLIRMQMVVLYFTTAFEKSRGGEWHDGSAVFQALEIEQLRRFGAPGFLTDNELLVQVMTYGTLVVEFALPVLLLWPRTRRIAVILGIAMHFGFDIFLELGFFGPAMIVGLLSFLPSRDAERIVGATQRLLGRAPSVPEPQRLATSS